MHSCSVILLLAASAHALTKVAVLGPGDPWVSLNAAKTAHKQGLTSSIACNKPGEAQNMLWGPDLTAEDEAKIKVVEGAEGIGAILADAARICVGSELLADDDRAIRCADASRVACALLLTADR